MSRVNGLNIRAQMHWVYGRLAALVASIALVDGVLVAASRRFAWPHWHLVAWLAGTAIVAVLLPLRASRAILKIVLASNQLCSTCRDADKRTARLRMRADMRWTRDESRCLNCGNAIAP